MRSLHDSGAVLSSKTVCSHPQKCRDGWRAHKLEYLKDSSGFHRNCNLQEKLSSPLNAVAPAFKWLGGWVVVKSQTFKLWPCCRERCAFFNNVHELDNQTMIKSLETLDAVIRTISVIFCPTLWNLNRT